MPSTDLDNNPFVTLRPMTAADIPAGMRLKDEAGWNQTESDWAMILNASPGGCFVAVLDSTVVGTITTVIYGNDFSWLGMLLVSPEYRRQGIGTMLLKSAIDFAKDYGAICLDARPVGVPLYRSLGFLETGTLVRMERPGSPYITGTASARIIPDENVLKAVCAYDRPLFEADRSGILTSLYRSAPQYAFFTSNRPDWGSSITGYCLGRSGSKSEQLGPILADTAADAQRLLSTALMDCAHKNVIVDVPAGNSAWRQWLEKQGFLIRHTYTRMVLGQHRAFGQPEKMYTIAGPELG